MAKVYVVTVFDAGEYKTEPWKVIENEFEAYDYAARLNREWAAQDDHSEATVSVHEFESKFEKALKEIEVITRGLCDFNPTYDKIHQIVKEVLEGTE